MATKKLNDLVIDALEDIKARDIKLINVSKLTSVFDYIAVASAESTRQTKALANHVMDKVKEAGGWIYGIEGEQSGEWVLVDCGDVVVHIMQPAVREHYKLEELWNEGKLEFPKPVAPKRKPVAATASKTTKTAVAKNKKAPATTTTKALKPTTVKPKIAKPKVTKPKATKPKTTKTAIAKTGKASETAKVGKEKETVAKAKVVTKKAVATRKKVDTNTVKKVAAKEVTAKKPAAKKPVARRRKAGAE